MSVELTTKFAPQTDDLFKAESKVGLLTNTDYDWTGAHAIKLYKISTTPLNDYSRNRSTAPEDTSESLSRYGKLLDLSATTEELLLKHDRSFIFNVDRLDQDETQQQLEAGTALARELREVVIPEVDTNVYTVMTTTSPQPQRSPSPTSTLLFWQHLRRWTMQKCPKLSVLWSSPRQPMRCLNRPLSLTIPRSARKCAPAALWPCWMAQTL